MPDLNVSTGLADDSSLSPRFLTANACAARYGFSPAHWRRLVDAGKAPRPVKLGRLVRWQIRTLEEWEAMGCQSARHLSTKGGQR